MTFDDVLTEHLRISCICGANKSIAFVGTAFNPMQAYMQKKIIMTVKKAIGQRGSWFASVDGEWLPCVHEHWWRQKHYLDPNAKNGDAKFDQLLISIKQKMKVVLTKDKVLNDGRNFERTGYIGVYAVEHVALDDRGLQFEFTKRLFSLTK